ncbi:ATP-dependent sacrificial sulfur transferase LarE [Jiangella muralis]|uniref:ATP-dependent sacrificial sulfur transferase LarE n=1 Tax=Jiangella muralis TaxID=702383 RepID=UPI000AFAC7DC|nr:ATP-dependent sacrificial sulfur transferase LarE [Jiangella muralis]
MTVVELHAVLSGPDRDATAAFTAQLGPVRSAAVAFSGGVDSSVVTALAARHLGPDAVVAVLGVSASLAESERRQACETSAAIGVALVEVETHELDDARYVANSGDRCYFCKHELYIRAFAEAVQATGSQVLLNGDTADDALAGDRPGRRAAEELGVRSPLAAAGIGKHRVRSLARALGLPVWDKPAAPCLASRVAVNLPVTVDVLARVERAEAALRDLGLRDLRVRHLRESARVELGADDLAHVRARGLVERVLDAVRAAGYSVAVLADAPLRRA